MAGHETGQRDEANREQAVGDGDETCLHRDPAGVFEGDAAVELCEQALCANADCIHRGSKDHPRQRDDDARFVPWVEHEDALRDEGEREATTSQDRDEDATIESPAQARDGPERDPAGGDHHDAQDPEDDEGRVSFEDGDEHVADEQELSDHAGERNEPLGRVGAPFPQDDQDEERRDGGERKMQGRDGLNGGLLSRDG